MTHINYETDPRPIGECLKEFGVAVNEGKIYRSRMAAARELRVSPDQLGNWIDRDSTPCDGLVRRAMTEILQNENGRPKAAV